MLVDPHTNPTGDVALCATIEHGGATVLMQLSVRWLS